MYQGTGFVVQRKQAHIDMAEKTPGKTSLDYAIQETLTQQGVEGVNTPADVALCQPVRTSIQVFLDGTTVHYVQTQVGTYLLSLDQISEAKMFAEIFGGIKSSPDYVTLFPYHP